MQKILSKIIQGKILLFFVMFIFVASIAFGSLGDFGGIKTTEIAEAGFGLPGHCHADGEASSSGANIDCDTEGAVSFDSAEDTDSGVGGGYEEEDVNNDPVAPEGLECFYKFGMNLGDCFALMGFYAFFVPSNMLLSVAGSIFDAMVAFSLSNDVMNQPFVMDTWEIVRDLANMAFIFVLLYISIATILSLGNYKKLLVNIVIVALVINFSAFFTKIVIDASNIIALEFYNAIGAPPGNNIKSGGGIDIIPESRISTAFMSGFDPQNIAGNDAFKDWKKKGESASSLFFVFLAAGIVQIVTAFVFFAAGFLFIGRMVAFWFLIIASPIAFIAYVLPGARGMFSKWWQHLISQALVAPVFLFFMYVIAKLVNSDFLRNIFPRDSDTYQSLILNTILVFSVLLITILMALDVTKKLSGQAGSMATKFAGGNLAMKYGKKLRQAAGTQTGGRFAHFASNKIAGTGFARKHPTLGRFATTNLDKAGSKYGKYVKTETKKRTTYGARVTSESASEKKKRLQHEERLQSTFSGEELKTQLGYAKTATETTREARKSQYASSITPGKVGKITQRITGQDRINTEAARNIKAGKKGEDSPEEKLMKMIKESVKKEMKESGGEEKS